MYLNNNREIYDVVYMDAYSDFSYPWHLATLEADEQIYASLNTDGFFIINVISSIEGNSGHTFRSLYRTLKEAFTQVYVFPVGHPEDGKLVQNIILVAEKEKNNISIPKIPAYIRNICLIY